MVLGVLADVHGNRHALERVLGALEREGVDAYVCAGDVVGYGPYPNECVELIAGRRPTCIAGNHDLIAVGRLSADGIGDLARETLEWTVDALDDGSRRYLSELPLSAQIAGTVVAHGGIDDPRRYVIEPAQAAAELELLSGRRSDASLLILGHTHRPLAYGTRSGAAIQGSSGEVELERGQRYLLNPGSVGQARERRPVARYMVLDLAARRASFRELVYDDAACRSALRAKGLPSHACHKPPPRGVRAVSARALRKGKALARSRLGATRARRDLGR